MTEQAINTESPTLESVIRLAFQHLMADMRVGLPGRIEKYDGKTHLASVRPLLKRRYRGRKEPVTLPLIERVPVVHPRTDKALIRLPVNPGDIVLLVFADRALDNWVAGDGSEKEPLDTRMHHLNDAYAILGGYPEGKPPPEKYPDALEINVKSGTKVAVTNGEVELLDLLNQVIEHLDNALANIQLITVNGNLGYPTGKPINAKDFIDLQTSLSEVKTALAELKA